jgi:hypothetical protein
LGRIVKRLSTVQFDAIVASTGTPPLLMAMSIMRFVRRATDFNAETTRAMGEAFDAACLEKSEQSDIARELIALRIIEAAKKGERDPEFLKRAALITFER